MHDAWAAGRRTRVCPFSSACDAPPPLNCQKSCSSAVVEHRMDAASWHASAVKVAQQDVRINFLRGGGVRDAACAEHVGLLSVEPGPGAAWAAAGSERLEAIPELTPNWEGEKKGTRRGKSVSPMVKNASRHDNRKPAQEAAERKLPSVNAKKPRLETDLLDLGC